MSCSSVDTLAKAASSLSMDLKEDPVVVSGGALSKPVLKRSKPKAQRLQEEADLADSSGSDGELVDDPREDLPCMEGKPVFYLSFRNLLRLKRSRPSGAVRSRDIRTLPGST